MKTDGTKIPFLWASLGSTQQAAIDNSKARRRSDPRSSTTSAATAPNEDAERRQRIVRVQGHVLGDIIHSRPLFVDHPTDPRVYVGANDGMLHAFDADSGDEVFAYVPSFFISPASANFSQHHGAHDEPVRPHLLRRRARPTRPRSRSPDAGKTILVGGVGAGGKGLYALDITDPTAGRRSGGGEQDPVGDHADDDQQRRQQPPMPNLGYTYGIPVIAKLNDGTWAAIVGNGYNNTGTNQAVLYVIDLMTARRSPAIAPPASPGRYPTPTPTASPARRRSTPTATAWSTTSTPATSTAICGNST